MTHAESHGERLTTFPSNCKKIRRLNMKWGHGVTSDNLSAFCLFNESLIPDVPRIRSHKHISDDNRFVPQISATTRRKKRF